MANPDHLAKLKEGVRAWNLWREAFPRVRPDLSHGRLSCENLEGVNFDGAALLGASLQGANLRGARLGGSNLVRAVLSEALVPRDTVLEVHCTSLREADLRSAELTGADLRRADLSGANLCGANLMTADLRAANLSGADLRSSSLLNTNLSGANLSGADISRADFGGTVFGGTQLSGVDGLESCYHRSPSTLDHRTIQRSDRLPVSFLRGCGWPDSLIECIPSILANPIGFYSSVISYSHADKDFADDLYDKLQGRGLRCWKDDHALRYGDNIADGVGRAIRLWDKVVLICSKDSLESPWVLDEIDKALERERQYERDGRQIKILIPLFLDRYLFGWVNGRASYLRNRLAGDFTEWKDRDKFQDSFERLVKALRSDEFVDKKPPRSKYTR